VWLPVIQGVIARRVLVNYRVRPDALRSLLPAPFEPKTVGGWAMAGICLIRLTELRPRGVPASLGFSSENAAHRIAVIWNTGGSVQEGVFVRRRDTSAWWNVLAGGQLFPGVHHRADFDVEEAGDRLRIQLKSRDGATQVVVAGSPAKSLPSASVFGSASEASRFFELGSRGYSPGQRKGQLEGLELRPRHWSAVPFDVTEVHSSFFESLDVFPAGAAVFDNALLMRDIPHEWHALQALECPP
jgi:hypothetical protein